MVKTKYILDADKAQDKANDLLEKAEHSCRLKIESAESYCMGYNQAIHDLLNRLIRTEITNDNT